MPEPELDQQISETPVETPDDDLYGLDAPVDDPGSDDYVDAPEGDDSTESSFEDSEDKDSYTREEFDELKRRLELAEGLVDWDKVANTQVEEPGSSTDNTAADIESLFTPKEFTYTPDELEDILTEGNGETLVGLLKRQAEVIQHNTKLETMNLMARMMEQRLPVAVATHNFFERHPELSGPKGEELVEKVFDSVWAKNPKQSAMQLLRGAENQLSHVIKRAKEIAKNGGQRHNLAAREAGGNPLGTAPQSRRGSQHRNSNPLAEIGYNV